MAAQESVLRQKKTVMIGEAAQAGDLSVSKEL